MIFFFGGGGERGIGVYHRDSRVICVWFFFWGVGVGIGVYHRDSCVFGGGGGGALEFIIGIHMLFVCDFWGGGGGIGVYHRDSRVICVWFFLGGGGVLEFIIGIHVLFVCDFFLGGGGALEFIIGIHMLFVCDFFWGGGGIGVYHRDSRVICVWFFLGGGGREDALPVVNLIVVVGEGNWTVLQWLACPQPDKPSKLMPYVKSILYFIMWGHAYEKQPPNLVDPHRAFSIFNDTLSLHL